MIWSFPGIADRLRTLKRAATLRQVLDDRYTRIVSAVLSGGVARLLSSAVVTVSLPLTVRYLGPERYGVWVTVTSFAVWLNLLDLGVANSLTNVISQTYATGDRQGAARALTNAFVMTCAAATAAWCAFLLVCPQVNWNALLDARVSSSVEIRRMILASVAIVLLSLPANLAGKTLAGYQELHRWNQTLAFGALLGLGGLAVGIRFGASMPLLLVLSCGGTALAGWARLVWLFAFHKPWLRPRVRLVQWKSARDLLDSSWSFLLIQIAAVVVFSSDNLIVSHYLGAAEVTPYSVAWRLVSIGAVLQSLTFPALWPAYAEAYARGDSRWVRRTYSRTTKATFALNFVFAAFVVTMGRQVIRFWAGAPAVPSRSVLVAMAAWSVIYGSTTAQSCLLAALNRTRRQAVLSILAAAVNICLSVLLVQRIGSLGVILGTIASYLLVLVVPQTIIVERVLRTISTHSDAAMSAPPVRASECAL